MLRKNYYEILQVERSATPAEIKKVYQSLVRIHYPNNGDDLDIFHQILEAYRTLKNTESKSLHNECLEIKQNHDDFFKNLTEVCKIIQNDRKENDKKEIRNIKVAASLYVGLAISVAIAALLDYPTVSTSLLLAHLSLLAYLLNKAVKIINDQRNRHLFFEKEILPPLKEVADLSSVLRDNFTPKLTWR